MPGQGYWRNQRPPPGVALNYGHPLVRTAATLFPLNEDAGSVVTDAVTGRLGQFTGGTLWTPYGGLQGDNTNAVNTGWAQNLGTRFTIVLGFYWFSSASDLSYLAACWDGFDSRPQFSMQVGIGSDGNASGDRLGILFRGPSGDYGVSAGPIGQGPNRRLLVVVQNGSSLTEYIDGDASSNLLTGTAGLDALDLTQNVVPTVLLAQPYRFGVVHGVANSNVGVWFFAAYPEAFTPGTVRAYTDGAYAMFAPPVWRRYFVPGVTTQIAVPVSDVSAGGWTPSTGTDLWAMLDETVPDDTDYIISASGPVNAEAKVRLSPLTDPNSSTGHIVNYRFYKTPDGGARGDLTVTLYAADGTTSITSNTHTNVALGVVAGTFTLTGPQADAIPSADYATGLVIGVKANAP